MYLSVLRAAPSQEADDLGLLLGLLKGALSADRGNHASHPAMAEVGRMLLARA